MRQAACAQSMRLHQEETLRKQLERQEVDLDRQEHQLSTQRQLIEAQQNEIAKLKEERQEMQAEEKELRQKLATEQLDCAHLRDALRKEHERLATESDAYLAQLKAAAKDLSSRQSELCKLRDSLHQKSGRLHESEDLMKEHDKKHEVEMKIAERKIREMKNRIIAAQADPRAAELDPALDELRAKLDDALAPLVLDPHESDDEQCAQPHRPPFIPIADVADVQATRNALTKCENTAWSNADDAQATEELERAVASYRAVVDDTIGPAIHGRGIVAECDGVIANAIQQHKTIYDVVNERIIKDHDFEEFTRKLRELEGRYRDRPRPHQCEEAKIVADAVSVKSAFDLVVEGMLEVCPSVREDPAGCEPYRPSGLKKMERVVEKVALQPADGSSPPAGMSIICDMVRGTLVTHSFQCMGSIVDALVKLDERKVITLVRCKNRWTNPTAGGWRDAMFNFYVAGDKAKHVCEVQLVHAQLLTARKDLSGHEIYRSQRNAAEILELLGLEQQRRGRPRQELIQACDARTQMALFGLMEAEYDLETRKNARNRLTELEASFESEHDKVLQEALGPEVIRHVYLLKDNDEHKRASAVESLASFEPLVMEVHAEALIESLNDSSQLVLEQSLIAVEKLWHRASRFVKRALADEKVPTSLLSVAQRKGLIPELRRHALDIIGRLGSALPEKPISHLHGNFTYSVVSSMADEDNGVQLVARSALKTLQDKLRVVVEKVDLADVALAMARTDKEISDFTEELRSRTPQACQAAMKAMRGLPPAVLAAYGSSVVAMLDHPTDEKVRLEAIQTLHHLAPSDLAKYAGEILNVCKSSGGSSAAQKAILLLKRLDSADFVGQIAEDVEGLADLWGKSHGPVAQRQAARELFQWHQRRSVAQDDIMHAITEPPE